MLSFIRDWLKERRARKDTDRRLREMAVRGKVFGKMEQEGPSATGIFETVKKSLDDATDVKRKARETAERLNDSLKGKKPL